MRDCCSLCFVYERKGFGCGACQQRAGYHHVLHSRVTNASHRLHDFRYLLLKSSSQHSLDLACKLVIKRVAGRQQRLCPTSPRHQCSRCTTHRPRHVDAAHGVLLGQRQSPQHHLVLSRLLAVRLAHQRVILLHVTRKLLNFRNRTHSQRHDTRNLSSSGDVWQ